MRNEDFVRRSQLITPAAEEKLIIKALNLSCDSLILDLEDGVAPTSKAKARDVLRKTLKDSSSNLYPFRELGVRINGLESPWWLDDLLAIEGLPINTVVLPKIHCSEDVYTFEQLLRQLDHRSGITNITIQILIESASGLENAYAIARASTRCRSLIFGVGDFIASVGMSFCPKALYSVRTRVVTAAAAAGLQAIDHVHPDIVDIDGLSKTSIESKQLGFTGRWAIHPTQISPIEAAFSPSPLEMKEARRIIAAYENAKSLGRGTMTIDGQLVDEAVLKMARRHVDLDARLNGKGISS